MDAEPLRNIVERVRLVPDRYRTFDQDTKTALRIFRIGGQLLAELLDLGFPCRDSGGERYFDELDLANASLSLRLPSPRYLAMRRWPDIFRAAADSRISHYEVEISAQCGCADPGHQCEFRIPAEVLALAPDADPAAQKLRLTREVAATRRTGQTPPGLRQLFTEVSAFQFHILPLALYGDLSFLRATSLANCELASGYLVQRAIEQGWEARRSFGLLLSSPYSLPHFWPEIALDGVWTAFDPYMIISLVRWGVLAASEVATDQVLDPAVLRVAEDWVDLVQDSGGPARVSLLTRRRQPAPRQRHSGACREMRVRTLLIDNYDSFSYNLAHYLGQVNGVEPTVIRNDERGWRTRYLDRFDNVVISPGPGTPGVPADFGVCREVISEGRIPLLGVCLGHQGIAMLSGGTIALAPEPRHGRKSPVLHSGTGLFAGIPSPQEVVRYHSWVVDRLSAELEALAWTPDEMVMALRHRSRPQWGVQFHPESIATEHGRRLLANFAELTREWNLQHGRDTRARRSLSSAPLGRAVKEHVTYHLLVEELPSTCDAEQVYEALFLDHPFGFWLDSSRPDPRVGRFSVMGAAEGPLAEVVTADVTAGTVTVRSGQRARTEVRPFLDWLDDRLRGIEVVGGEELPFDFRCGWIGYLGYELKAQCGGQLRHNSEHPDALLLFASRCVVFDHRTSTTYLLALHTGSEVPARSWMIAARARIQAITGGPRSSTAQWGPGPGPGAVSVLMRHDRSTYLDLIESCQRTIVAGESYEVCLTNMLNVECRLDVWSAYRALRRDNPAPFAALLRLGDLSVLSTSPERFLRVDNERCIEARPMKGTRPRGRSAEEDEELRRDLASSEKDQAENLMIVDLLRNDLAQVATIGSVAVPELFAVETYATVHQLISIVTARLRSDCSAVDCVRAAFPGGSMTGAPKVRTMEIIDRLEEGPRGIYSGAIGYFSLSGSVDLSIAIRTLVAETGRVSYGVGGAIVAMSDPVAEYDETVVKATPLLSLLGTRLSEHTRRSRQAMADTVVVGSLCAPSETS